MWASSLPCVAFYFAFASPNGAFQNDEWVCSNICFIGDISSKSETQN